MKIKIYCPSMIKESIKEFKEAYLEQIIWDKVKRQKIDN